MGDLLSGLLGVAVWWVGAAGLLIFGVPHSNAGGNVFLIVVGVVLWSAVIGLSILSFRKRRITESASE